MPDNTPRYGDYDIRGDAGADRIEGGGGDDFAFGGAGLDTFVFRAGFGNDIVGDFSDGEVIELCGLGVSNFAALQSCMSEWNGTTYIDLGAGNEIALENVALSSLTADDFRFLAA